ncbi:MAG: hypothetical protein J7M24_04205, partial [Candidatus Latescibacteria bacterium]|nr:hypothetical protein [Candidatus Latescibacterota bacterium]
MLCAALAAGTATAQYTADTASALSENGSATGSLSDDHPENWWVFTTSADGVVTIDTQSTEKLDIDFSIYAADQATSLASSNTVDDARLEKTATRNDLAAGTYYVRITRGYYREVAAGSYTISATVTPTSLDEDTESNDTAPEAVTLPLDGSATGHIGYWSTEKTDDTDWYVVTTTGDGTLTVDTESVESLDLDISIYAADQATSLASSSTVDDARLKKTATRNDLAAGTFYIRITRGYYRKVPAGSYTVSSSFTATTYSNDSETGDSASEAIEIGENGSAAGHIGYWSLEKTDDTDWYVVTTSQDGELVIQSRSTEALDLEIAIYADDQATYLAGSN